MPRKQSRGSSWGIEKRISISNIGTFLAVIVFGVTFYNNSINYQQRTEERFAFFTDASKVKDASLADQQKVTQQMLIKLTEINERQNYITDTLKDLTTTIKTRSK